MGRIEIEINVELTKEQLEYIADCWVAFVTNDLGYQPADLAMLLP